MENTMNNEVITKETEATSESTELTPAKQDDVHVMTAGETAIGKKALAAGKAALQKAKEKKTGKFEKKAEEPEDLVEVDEN